MSSKVQFIFIIKRTDCCLQRQCFSVNLFLATLLVAQKMQHRIAE